MFDDDGLDDDDVAMIFAVGVILLVVFVKVDDDVERNDIDRCLKLDMKLLMLPFLLLRIVLLLVMLPLLLVAIAIDVDLVLPRRNNAVTATEPRNFCDRN